MKYTRSRLYQPALLFLPFLTLYVILILIFSSTTLAGDESRYLVYAQYMVTGVLPEGYETFNLFGNGPGYSFVLLPFVYLQVPLIVICLLNAVFYYLSVIFLYKSLLRLTSEKISLIVSIFWGLYLNLMEILPIINPDVFVVFLITFFCFLLLTDISERKFTRNTILACIVVAWICLTKPVFGYVLAFLILFSLIYLLVHANWRVRKLFYLCVVSLLFTLPYLAVTYTNTGKIFYWSSLGGNNLYWMSNPYSGEYGDWFPHTNLDSNLHKGHHPKIEWVLKDFGPGISKAVEQDDRYKELALENIKNHPGKFLYNCFSNLGRMLFNFPYSYKFQKPETLLRIPQNGIIVFLFLFSLIPASINRRQISPAFYFLIVFCLLYLGGSTLASAEIRMFTLVVPPMLIWIVYILQNSLRIQLAWGSEPVNKL